MEEATQLEQIANQMTEILGRFSRSREGIHIAKGDQAVFTGLALEADHIISANFSPANSFSFALRRTVNEGISNLSGSQSYHSVEQSAGIVNSAAKVLRRRPSGDPKQQPQLPPYVSAMRLAELRAISHPEWDLNRLVRLCEELNGAFAAELFFASGMLLRAITDHVPPLFGSKSFAEYVSQISGRSHKRSMDHLLLSLRNIADSLLHTPMRQQESIPNATQVDFRQDLDVLLAEVTRTLRQ